MSELLPSENRLLAVIEFRRRFDEIRHVLQVKDYQDKGYEIYFQFILKLLLLCYCYLFISTLRLTGKTIRFNS